MELLQVLSLILTQSPFRPDYYAMHGIVSLTPDRLQQISVKGLILDLDNTLMLPRLGYLLDDVAAWLQYMQKNNIKIVILSNNKRKDYMEQVKTVFEPYNIPVISHGKKPYKANIEKSLQLLELEAADCLIVGDRILTDILGGLHCNIRSVLVPPLIGDNEIPYKKYARKIEKLFLGQPKSYI